MSKQITINQDATEDGMFSGDWSGVDMDASAEKYAALVLAQVSECYPGIPVEINLITEATRNTIDLDGYVYPERDEVLGVVEHVMDRIYNDFESWVVNE